MACAQDTSKHLHLEGVSFNIGSYRCRIRCDFPELADPLATLYQDYSLIKGLSDGLVCDFDIEITKNKNRPWSDVEATFRWKGYPALPPLPVSQVHPLFEWGLNWCMATLLGTEIVIHAAIVERNGCALIMPGEPGAGKSTLCAALVLSGWRLLSDELTVLSIQSCLAQPLPRPISLKDSSIGLIAKCYPDAQMTEPVHETRKGVIAYVRPPSDAIKRWHDCVPVRFVLFPQFKLNADLSVEDLPHAACLAKLMASTFNLGLLGHEGFAALSSVVAGAKASSFEYGNLDAALEWIDRNCL
jgi:HprK-related kinase A